MGVRMRYTIQRNDEHHAQRATLVDALASARELQDREPRTPVTISDHQTGMLVLGWWLIDAGGPR